MKEEVKVKTMEVQIEVFRKRVNVLEGVVGELLDMLQQANPKKVEQLREKMGSVKTKLLQTEEINDGKRQADRASA